MGYLIAAEDLDILKAFIVESTEYLQDLEKELLKLELDQENSELINDIFRRVHSIKGLASFLSFSCISNLSHHIEFALDHVRKKKIEANTALINCLLDGVDLLSTFICTLQERVKDFKGLSSDQEIEIELGNEDKVICFIKNIEEILEQKEAPEEQEPVAKDIENTQQPDFDILKTDEFKNKISAGLKDQFVIETSEHIDKIEGELLVSLDKAGDDDETINDLFRCIHSIKGGAGIVLSTLLAVSPISPVVKNISIVMHSFESLLATYRDKHLVFNKDLVSLSYEVVDYLKAAIEAVDQGVYVDISIQTLLGKMEQTLGGGLPSTVGDTITTTNEVDSNRKESVQKNPILQSIRVSQEKIDTLMNTIGELITTKNAFMHVAKTINVEYNIPELAKEVKEIGFAINRISEELQNSIMSVRMIEVKNIFQKLPRIIRDISQSTGKKINLLMEGEDTEIDKTIVEQISDPLVHIIRNAADHGIESSAIRQAQGKDETGTIVLRAYKRNKNVFIEIEDDGKGINTEELKKNAIQKGFIKSMDADKMNRNQLLNLIFLPGFSTAKKVTEVSGRGVGMDIVKSNISKVNGLVFIESEEGKGTKMIIQLPLTLAVSRGLLIEASQENYIIPIENIVETVKINRNDIHKYNDRQFTYLRGEVIGLEWLSTIFSLEGKTDSIENDVCDDKLNSVIVSNGLEKVAIIVDKLRSEQEFVVKSLSDCLASIPGISGSTLLGNGKVVLILNPTDIIKMADTM